MANISGGLWTNMPVLLRRMSFAERRQFIEDRIRGHGPPRTLIDNLPAPRPHRHSTVPASPKHDLGDLSRLPAELLRLVLSHLDLESFAAFRQTNRLASTQSALPALKHVPDVLRCIYLVGAGARITAHDLYEILIRPGCNCGNPGDFFSVLALQRACFHCLSREDRFLPLTYAEASFRFRVHGCVFDGAVRIRILPGAYAFATTSTPQRRFDLVDYRSARQAALSHWGSEQNLQEAMRTKAGPFQPPVGANRLPCWRGIEYWHPTRPCMPDTQAANPARFMAAVPLPHLDTAGTGSLLRSFACPACAARPFARPATFRAAYLAPTPAEHARLLGPVVGGAHDVTAAATPDPALLAAMRANYAADPPAPPILAFVPVAWTDARLSWCIVNTRTPAQLRALAAPPVEEGVLLPLEWCGTRRVEGSSATD